VSDMSNTEPIDLTALIEALKKVNRAETYEDQLTELEIALVEAELNPKPSKYVSMIWGIDLVKQIDITKRRWQPLELDLSAFFAENQ